MATTKNTIDEKAAFLADLSRAAGSGPDWARAIRAAYATRFAELELPHRRMEDWRFTNIAPILRTQFQTRTLADGAIAADAVAPFRYGDGTWTELVFVDGFFSKELSTAQAGVTAMSLREAMASHTNVVENHLSKHLNGTANAFIALNTAFLLDGAFIHVAGDTSVAQPIHILMISTGRVSDAACHPRNLFVIDPGARATVVESHVALETSARYLTNAVTEISVGENATFNLCKLIQESEEAYHLATTTVRLERGANFSSIAVSQAGKIIRNEIRTLLDGEGAHCSLKGLYMTRGDQLVDNPIAIEHSKPNCTSWIGYKGVLDDRSHAVFSGKVYVHRVAQKTDSNQLNQNMVLSDKAMIDTKPLLEIFADDVKCTHGATVGRPPDELVFYFRTRGMSEAMALGMLTYGFADEVVNQIEVDPVRERLERFVFNTYSPIPG